MSVKKSINQIGNLTQIIANYDSITAAAVTTKINKSNIQRSLLNGTSAGNYFWEYADQPTEQNQPTIWLYSFEKIEQELIQLISINHKGSKKFLPKYLYFVHLLIANRGKEKIINSKIFCNTIGYRNFDIIVRTWIELGVVQVSKELEQSVDGDTIKRVSRGYTLTEKYKKEFFRKVEFTAANGGKMIKKLMIRNDENNKIQPEKTVDDSYNQMIHHLENTQPPEIKKDDFEAYYNNSFWKDQTL